ncbi:MAG: hypothetical protein HY052_09360 [Proteobacteria bacterium]|nr:hypothetical protein [Pseudomonadota bacterium]
MSRFANARKELSSPVGDVVGLGWASPVFRAQDIILERLPLNPRAGARISGGHLVNAYRQCIDEGIGHKGYKAGLERLVHDGHLEQVKGYSYRLTALGESYLSILSTPRRSMTIVM